MMTTVNDKPFPIHIINTDTFVFSAKLRIHQKMPSLYTCVWSFSMQWSTIT